MTHLLNHLLNRTLALVLVLCAMAPLALHAEDADEAKVRQAIQVKFPKMSVESVNRLPFGGLFEVVMTGEIIYTDIKAEYIMGGSVYDLRGALPRNVTEETTQKLASKALTSSHDAAIKMVRGNGKRVIYTFEDPNCGYCRELYKEFGKMNDITVYTYLLPVLSPDSAEKSRAVWCAKDRAKAWEQLMTKAAQTEATKPCDTPLERNALLAQRFNIKGTPAIFLASGQQLGGYVPAARIEQALAASVKK